MSPQADPWTGPWAQDARRIFELIQAAVPDPQPADPDAAQPPECRYCPLCQGIAMVRLAGPETLDRVAELAAGLAATLRAAEPEPGAAPTSQASSTRPSAPTSTVRIDVTD